MRASAFFRLFRHLHTVFHALLRSYLAYLFVLGLKLRAADERPAVKRHALFGLRGARVVQAPFDERIDGGAVEPVAVGYALTAAG